MGYLLGKVCTAEKDSTVMKKGTSFFEVEELYVIPTRRSQGLGGALFRFVQEQARKETQYILLSTATKNWRAILRFYIEELDMEFWSARLFKKIE